MNLSAQALGDGIIVFIFNENAHIGAVAVGEYDHENSRTSTSVITRLGHKDDSIAQQAVYLISKHTKGTSCVVAGVHLNNITEREIKLLLRNAKLLTNDFLKWWQTESEGLTKPKA